MGPDGKWRYHYDAEARIKKEKEIQKRNLEKYWQIESPVIYNTDNIRKKMTRDEYEQQYKDYVKNAKEESEKEFGKTNYSADEIFDYLHKLENGEISDTYGIRTKGMSTKIKDNQIKRKKK